MALFFTRWAVSDLQRDVELIAGLLWDKGTMRHWEAWQRIRASLGVGK